MVKNVMAKGQIYIKAIIVNIRLHYYVGEHDWSISSNVNRFDSSVGIAHN